MASEEERRAFRSLPKTAVFLCATHRPRCCCSARAVNRSAACSARRAAGGGPQRCPPRDSDYADPHTSEESLRIMSRRRGRRARRKGDGQGAGDNAAPRVLKEQAVVVRASRASASAEVHASAQCGPPHAPHPAHSSHSVSDGPAISRPLYAG